MYKLLQSKKQTIKGRMLNTFDHKYDFEDHVLNSKQRKDGRKPVQKWMSSYVLGKDLVNAINAALITGRPLLLKGAPGCGKTKVALAIAKWFHGVNANKFYFEWHVKSKSKAKDGAYTYDHIRRLRDATLSEKQSNVDVKDAKNYIELGPMGMAFKAVTGNTEKPVVLLIDEIDKGDIDFPNDLLLELDELRFVVEELDQQE
ncbi:MAG: AAA family ATPase, partial [Bacteroidota bacterium]